MRMAMCNDMLLRPRNGFRPGHNYIGHNSFGRGTASDLLVAFEPCEHTALVLQQRPPLDFALASSELGTEQDV